MSMPPTPYPYPVAGRAAPRPPAAPPLGARRKRGAFWAGFLGLNLVNLGGSLVLIAVAAGLALGAASWLIRRMAGDGGPGSALGPEPLAFLAVLQRVDALFWLGLLAIVGLALLAAGVLVSYTVLRRHGVDSPGAVTWSAVGLAMPALVAVGFVLSVIGQIVGAAASFGSAPWWSANGEGVPGADVAIGVTVAVGGILITAAVVGVVGWLLWWWMAHLLRGPVP